jgi:hypothetical protein
MVGRLFSAVMSSVKSWLATRPVLYVSHLQITPYHLRNCSHRAPVLAGREPMTGCSLLREAESTSTANSLHSLNCRRASYSLVYEREDRKSKKSQRAKQAANSTNDSGQEVGRIGRRTGHCAQSAHRRGGLDSSVVLTPTCSTQMNPPMRGISTHLNPWPSLSWLPRPPTG